MPAAEGPGRAATDPPSLAADLARGNVVLVAARGQVRAAERLATELAGPPGDALRRAGQAVLVEPREGSEVVSAAPAGGGGACAVRALAHGRELCAPFARHPSVREFAEFWLGRGAPG